MAVSTDTTDVNWVRRAFSRVRGTYRNPYTHGDETRTTYTTASATFVNSSVGGNFAINPPYQFTRWADIRHPPRGGSEENANEGMGSYYADAIEKTAQVVHFSFGVPEFNSISSFFFNFFDARTALLVNYGRINELFYNIGDVLTFIFTLPFQPFIIGAKWLTNALDFIKDTGSSKWCYFKPTMHTYWSAVNNIANELAINMGITPRIASPAFNSEEASGGMSPTEMARLANMWMPQLFRDEKTGGIDVMALSREAQRRAIRDRENLIRLRERQSTVEGDHAAILKNLSTKPEDPYPNTSTARMFRAYTDKVAGDQNNPPESGDKWKERWRNLNELAQASHEDGSQFMSVRVNNLRSMSESFSNSFETSGVAQMINGKVKQSRDKRFDFANGNISDLFSGVINAAASFAAAAADRVGAGGLLAAAGEAYVDIPEMWSDSAASMPSVSFTIPLHCPYGNPLSRFFDIALPIAHVLAAALPRSTGRSSYTSPFVCQWFYPGHTQCRYGMIESLEITRGDGNVGFNANNEMLSAEIRITVKDLTGIVHVPVFNYYQNRGALDTIADNTMSLVNQKITGDNAIASILTGHAFDEQSTFQDYMAVVGGLPISDTYYRMKRLKLNLTNRNQAFINNTSMSSWVSYLMDMPPARMVSGLAEESPRFK